MIFQLTHDHDEECRETVDTDAQYEMYQRDIRKEGLDIFGERDDSLMSNDHGSYDIFRHISLVRDLTHFSLQYVNLSA